MAKLSAIRIGHLRIFDHLMLGFAYNSNGAALLKHTDHPMMPVPMNSWNHIKNAFLEGDLHGAFIPLPEAMNMFDRGMELKVLLSDCRLGAYIVGNISADVNKLNDFKGKTILISNYLSVHHLLLYRLLASAGLKAGLENESSADVYIETAPPFIVSEMLKNDDASSIGGCFIEEPFGSDLIKQGLGKIICPSVRLWPSHPASVLIVHDYVIEDHRTHLMDIIHFIVASSRFVSKESDDLHKLCDNFFPKELRFNDIITSALMPAEPNSLMPHIQSFETINKFMVNEMRVMSSIIDIPNFVDSSFAIEAGA